MADLAERLTINAPGKFYVDSTRIDCDRCRQIAPDTFARHDEAEYSYVVRQPFDPDEDALACEAAESCPTDSIGMDAPTDTALL